MSLARPHFSVPGLTLAGLLILLGVLMFNAVPSSASVKGCRQATIGDLESVEEKTGEAWGFSARYPQFRLAVARRNGRNATLRVQAKRGNSKRNPKAGEDFRYGQMVIQVNCPSYMWLLREVKKRGCWPTTRVPGTGKPGYMCQTKWWPAKSGNNCEPSYDGIYLCKGRWRKVRLGEPTKVRVPPGRNLRVRVRIGLPDNSRPGTGVPVLFIPGKCLCQFNGGRIVRGSTTTNDVLLR